MGECDRLPFEAHRVVEYVLGVALVWLYMNDYGRLPVVGGAGVAVLVLAAVTQGRLGLARWCPLGLHRAVDALLVVAMVAAPFAVGEPLAAIYLLPAAAVVAMVALRTDYRTPRPAAGTTEPVSPKRTDDRAARFGPTEPVSPERTDDRAGRPAVGLAELARLRLSPRNVGRLAGRTVAAARQAAQEEQPDADNSRTGGGTG